MNNNTTLSLTGLTSDQFVIYPKARISIVVMGILILITSSTVLSVLWFYLKTAVSPATIYIRAIVVSSLLGISIGQSVTLVTYARDFQIYSYKVCNGIRVVTLSIHFWSNITNLILLTAMCIDRQQQANKLARIPLSPKQSSRQRWILLISIALGTLNTAVLSYLWSYQGETINGITNGWNECAYGFQHQLRNCKGLFSRCSEFPVVMTVAFTITVCSNVLFLMTRKLKQKITASDKRISAVLCKDRITNTKRIQATHYLWIASTFEFLPYGIARLTIYADFSMNTYFTISAIFHTISTLHFVSVPLVYYNMDRKFYDYVHNLRCLTKKECRDKQSNVDNVTPNV